MKHIIPAGYFGMEVGMKIYSVEDTRFKRYGKVIKDIDFSGLVKALEEHTPLPEGVEYVPGLDILEALPVKDIIRC